MHVKTQRNHCLECVRLRRSISPDSDRPYPRIRGLRSPENWPVRLGELRADAPIPARGRCDNGLTQREPPTQDDDKRRERHRLSKVDIGARSEVTWIGGRGRFGERRRRTVGAAVGVHGWALTGRAWHQGALAVGLAAVRIRQNLLGRALMKQTRLYRL